MKNIFITTIIASITFNGYAQQNKLPRPFETKDVTKYSNVIGWPKGKTPIAPKGFKVSLYANNLRNARNIYVAANGDVFASQANTEMSGIKKIGAAIKGVTKSQNLDESANNILLFQDTNGDGIADAKRIFLKNLTQPYGMLVLGDWFYVANTDGLYRYPYKLGQTQVSGAGKKILSLPAGGYNNHWTRNLLANANGTKIYIAVGSGTNIGEKGMEHEVRRAAILEINPDGSGEKIYASGLRNPVGIDLQPGTGTLFTAVNERDGLGDNLVPDYLTSVKPGGFYGWPYSYFGQNLDPRVKEQRPDLVKRAIVPDVQLGSHTASLGLAFYKKGNFPQRYHNGAFIGQHGSWNRSTLAGYKVLFVPFTNGKPGKPQDFLTGFIANLNKGEVYGRPVGVAVTKDGSLLVADDASNCIWRVSVK